MNVIKIAALLFLLIGCGRYEGSEAEPCYLQPQYIGGSPSNGTAGFETVLFRSSLSSSCLALVGNRSGGVKISLRSVAAPSQARLLEIDLSGERRIRPEASGTGAQPTTFTSGSLAYSQEFQAGVSEVKDRWLLPWSDAPTEASVYFELLSPLDQTYLPSSVVLSIEYLEK